MREPPLGWRYTMDLGGPTDDPRWLQEVPTVQAVRALTKELSASDFWQELREARAQLRQLQAEQQRVLRMFRLVQLHAQSKEAPPLV